MGQQGLILYGMVFVLRFGVKQMSRAFSPSLEQTAYSAEENHFFFQSKTSSASLTRSLTHYSKSTKNYQPLKILN